MCIHQRAKIPASADFAQVAEREARERDAYLHAGNDPAQIAQQRFDDASPRVTLFDELPHARLPDPDERKFRRREKGVHAHQRDYGEELKRYQAPTSRVVNANAHKDAGLREGSAGDGEDNEEPSTTF